MTKNVIAQFKKKIFCTNFKKSPEFYHYILVYLQIPVKFSQKLGQNSESQTICDLFSPPLFPDCQILVNNIGIK